MVSTQSIIHCGLRFSLKKFFRNALADLGIAPGQLSTNAWKILTALYIGCHTKSQVDCLDVAAFLHCYFIMTTRSSGQFYFCLLDGHHLVDNVKENAKERNLFFKVTYIDEEPLRTRFVDAELRAIEVQKVMRLHATFGGVGRYIDGAIVRDPVAMNEYFIKDYLGDIGIYCFFRS